MHLSLQWPAFHMRPNEQNKQFNLIYNLNLAGPEGAVHKVRHAILDQFWPPSPCHTLSHISGPNESTSHISEPPIFCSTFIHTYVFYREVCLSSRGFSSGGFCPWFFVWKVLLGVDLSVRLLSEYIRYNRKPHIAFNFRFHMYEKIWKVWRHMLLELPRSQTVTPSRTPPPRAWRTLWTARLLACSRPKASALQHF